MRDMRSFPILMARRKLRNLRFALCSFRVSGLDSQGWKLAAVGLVWMNLPQAQCRRAPQKPQSFFDQDFCHRLMVSSHGGSLTYRLRTLNLRP